MGDISETPPDSAKIQKVTSPDIDFTDKTDAPENVKDKKKDRSSRFFGTPNESKDHKEHKEHRDSKDHKEHPKLAKRLSRLNGKEKEKPRDKEDGIFSKDIPMAGIAYSLMFTYSYTRKGG